MKKFLFLALVSNFAFAMNLPKLHEIKEVTLKKAYSCDNGDYKTAAVYLSSHSKDQNSPDLLYNGTCQNNAYLEASTAGDDFALIADLGEVSLEEVTASKAFNWTNTSDQSNVFKESAVVKMGHVYVVLTSKSDIRSLVAYKVVEFDPNGALKLKYAVKSYSVQKTKKESDGFDWEARNF